MRGICKRALTPNDRNRLVQILLHMGRAEAESACIEFGVDRYYAINRARGLGITLKKVVFRGYGNVSPRVDHDDPRWAWAIERGEVRV